MFATVWGEFIILMMCLQHAGKPRDRTISNLSEDLILPEVAVKHAAASGTQWPAVHRLVGLWASQQHQNYVKMNNLSMTSPSL